jgi:uncharacterized LabA/DUF88 family protein
MAEKPHSFVVLIDGDNIELALIPKIIDKVSEFGKPIIKKLYLNNSSLPQLPKLSPIINTYTIQPEWIPNNTSRKNAADIALVIDAMHYIYNGDDITAFCIVSSDSDFTGLAAYIVGKNLFMLGIGEGKTPISFVNACSQFIKIEELKKPQAAAKPVRKILTPEAPKQSEAKLASFSEELFVHAYNSRLKNSATNGWIPLVEIKEEMISLDKQFQSSGPKYTRLLAERVKQFAASYPSGIIKIEETVENTATTHYINIDCDAYMFVAAYRHAPKKEANGWVTLSAIGDELSKDAKSENGFRYQEVRKQQLLKVVIDMVKDYPAIQIKEEKEGKIIKHLVRIKS